MPEHVRVSDIHTFEIPTRLARLGPGANFRLPFPNNFSFLVLPNMALARSSFCFRSRSSRSAAVSRGQGLVLVS